MTKTPSPSDYRATPYIICDDAAKAIEWYVTVFGAEEMISLKDPSGKVMHAEVRVGDAPIMIADEFPEMGYKSPKTLGGSPVAMYLYVDDVDATFKKAIENGAEAIKQVEDEFDGDRRGSITDPFGHNWYLATSNESISYDELKARFDKMMQG
jgi:PhnB protein